MQADVNHAPAAYETAIRLEFSDGSAPLTKLDEVNLALARYGALLWPIDLGAAPQSIGRLLAQETLTPAESGQVRDHFLLSRERLLQLIAEAGRKPQVPGGGDLNTSDTTNNVTYPQLYIVAAGFDYSRFDKFHVNGALTGQALTKFSSFSPARISESFCRSATKDSSPCASPATIRPAGSSPTMAAIRT